MARGKETIHDSQLAEQLRRDVRTISTLTTSDDKREVTDFCYLGPSSNERKPKGRYIHCWGPNDQDTSFQTVLGQPERKTTLFRAERKGFSLFGDPSRWLEYIETDEAGENIIFTYSNFQPEEKKPSLEQIEERTKELAVNIHDWAEKIRKETVIPDDISMVLDLDIDYSD